MRPLQKEIIEKLGVRPVINPEEEIANRREFLARYLGGSSALGFVLGISGGQDSLLAGILAQQAAELLRASGRGASFHAALLPYGDQADRGDALLAINTIKPDYTHDFNIKTATDALAEEFALKEGRPLLDYHKGNVKARIRMIVQYMSSGMDTLRVIGTDHAAEAVAGFFTKYGDGGADVVPLAGLNKRQGRQMLVALGVPPVFIQKPPTADLLDTRPGQPDEVELGLSYDTYDDYLEGKEIDPNDADKIEREYIATLHKRELPTAYQPRD